MKNKVGQITIFIIIALVIIAGIVVFFVLRSRFSAEELYKENPKDFIDKCVQDEIKNSVDEIMNGGGVINPWLYKQYQDEKYNYLCYQRNDYLACVNQFPMLKSVAENEIKKNTEEKVRQCFDELRNEFEAKGFEVAEGELDYKIELVSGAVKIKINKKFDTTKVVNSQSLSDFGSEIISPLYNLIMIAREIVNQESQFCNFEYNGFMALYPKYNIKRIDYDDSKLYELTDKLSGKQFKFAVRSCVLPPGI